ncbi:MAG: RDD family protein [Pseudomonadota bacterium]
MNYVGVGLRFVAVIIDTIIFFILSYIVALFTGGTTGAGFQLSGVPALLSFIIFFLYYIILEALVGATVGKLALGMRVVTADGHKIGWGASVIRNILRIIDGIPFILLYLLGAILVWTSQRKQRLGDRLGGTVVIRGRAA